MKKQQIIDNFIVKEFNKNLKNWFILQNDDGTYLLFNKFHIVNENKKFLVYQLTNSVIETFNDVKNAVTWCIFEKLGKYYEAEEVKNLDRKLETICVNQIRHNYLIRNTKEKQQRILYFTKLTEELAKKKVTEEQLDFYINTSRYWLDKRLKELTQ